MSRVLLSAILVLMLAPHAFGQTSKPPDSHLGRGVNFGNMLDAPSEGAWGVTARPEYFKLVADAGFEHIRLPVSWAPHTDANPPYAIDPAFMARVDECIDQALAAGLRVIVDAHHDNALHANPAAESPRALAIWRQIATHMRDRPDTVYFEVLNEPHGAFNEDPATWNTYLAEALAIIRETNPTRGVLAGPVRWNAVSALPSFDPPKDDHLILTVHYYLPFEFTHQGASWAGDPPPVGTTWDPGAHTIVGPWDNWSWNTTISPSDAGMRVEYQAGWVGLYFHRGEPLIGAKSLTFTVDRELTLNVVINKENALPPRIETEGATRKYTVQMPDNIGPISDVMIINASPEAQPPFTLSSIHVETADAEEPIIGTQQQAIDLAMRRAAQWGHERGLPVYLGEFGAYSAADMPSRVRWTRAMRDAAERYNIDWGYWELAAGFGIYDPEAREWRKELLGALMD